MSLFNKKTNWQITILWKESLSDVFTGWLTVNNEGEGGGVRGEGWGGRDRFLREATKQNKAVGFIGHCKSSTEECFKVKLGRGSYAL